MMENPNVICNDCEFCKQNKELKKQIDIALNVLETIAEDDDDYIRLEAKHGIKRIKRQEELKQDD